MDLCTDRLEDDQRKTREHDYMIILGVLVDPFQPPYIAHKKSYDLVVQERGKEYSYIVASDKTFNGFNPYYPLGFSDKEQILTKHGIPSEKILKGYGLFDTREFSKMYNSNDVALIYYFFGDIDGNLSKPSQMIPWQDGANTNIYPMAKAIYYKIIPDDLKKIKGVKFDTVSFIKELGNPQNTDDNKKTFFTLTFGWYDAGFFNLVKDRFAQAYKQYISRYGQVEKSETLDETVEVLAKTLAEDMMSAISMDTTGNSTTSIYDKNTKDKSPTDVSRERNDKNTSLRNFEKSFSIWKDKTRKEGELNRRKSRELDKIRNNAKRALNKGEDLPNLPTSI